MALTANYSFIKPTVGGDIGTWGGDLNTDLDSIDTQIKVNEDAAAAAQTTADAALPKAGGVMTGRADLFSSQTKRVDIGNISGAQALDLAVAQAFTATVTGGVTISFTNVPSGTFLQGVFFEITNGGSGPVTWPGTVEWAGGTTPTLTTSGKDLIALVSVDAGTTWQGSVLLDLS